MKPIQYTARWSHDAGLTSLGNVSFFAASDAAAKRKADRIAIEIGLPNTPRTLSRGAQCIEVLQTGMSRTP